MAEKKKKTEPDADETAVEETEAATPAVDEGAPVASSDVADQTGRGPGGGEPSRSSPTRCRRPTRRWSPRHPSRKLLSRPPSRAPEPEARRRGARCGSPAAEAEPAVEEPAEEPAAEAEAERRGRALQPTSPAAAAPAAPAQQSGPKPKRKRLPRSLRPQRTRPQRDKPTERKPIVRLPKPEQELGRRQERQGTVVSDAMDKTIVVKVDTIGMHRRYKKVIRQSKKFHAHDETNEAKIGDVVRIVETRPLSKSKNWRLAEILEVAK